jgi:hypothetical protein
MANGEKQSYKDHEIEVVEEEGRLELRVDGDPVSFQQDDDTGLYFTPAVPYRFYDSLLELGKAMVDED